MSKLYQAKREMAKSDIIGKIKKIFNYEKVIIYLPRYCIIGNRI